MFNLTSIVMVCSVSVKLTRKHGAKRQKKSRPENQWAERTEHQQSPKHHLRAPSKSA